MTSVHKERILGIRLGELTESLEKFEAGTGLGGASLGKELLRSALAYFLEHGEFVLPIAVIPKSELALLKANAGRSEDITTLRIAESVGKYGSKTSKPMVVV